jgi:hypothetical protein
MFSAYTSSSLLEPPRPAAANNVAASKCANSKIYAKTLRVQYQRPVNFGLREEPN